MSDKQRSEARRRKILENAESRFKKILNHDSTSSAPEGEPSVSKQHNFQKIIPKCDNGEPAIIRPKTAVGQEGLLTRKRVVFAAHNSDMQTTFLPKSQVAETSIAEEEFTNHDAKPSSVRDWLIILLALLVRFFFLLGEQYEYLANVQFLVEYNLNTIFVPLILYEITEFAFFRPCLPQNSLLNVLILMLNFRLQPAILHNVVTGFRLIVRVMQDLMIYFFAFACFDQVTIFVQRE